MKPFAVVWLGLMVSGLASASLPVAAQTADPASQESYRGVLLDAGQTTAEEMQRWHKQGYQLVLKVDQADPDTLQAARRIQQQAGTVEYFFEIARNPSLADDHPEWMASLQGHHEWSRLHPKFPKPQPGQVAKVYPWVPILLKEAFAGQLKRVESALQVLPQANRIWLHDIQGGPSACGCGHPLCRWTADYGPIHTATQLDDQAPAQFTAAVAKLAAPATVIPIFTSECEAEDQHTVCGGVGCFKGICWKAFTRQLDAVAQVAPQVGVSCLFREFSREQDRYGAPGSWAGTALKSFTEMPPLREGQGVPPERLIGLLQGWDVSPAEIQQQLQSARAQRVAGVLLSLTPIDQSWEPRMHTVASPAPKNE